MGSCTTDTLIPHCTTPSIAEQIVGNPLVAGVIILVAIVQWFEEGSGWLVLKWCARIALWLLMIPLAFLAWYMAAAIPVSIAILLGAGIIALAVRSSSGRLSRRLMGLSAHWEEEEPPALPSEQQHLRRFD